ncbi:hypothetical protein MASR2M70_13170 [Bacillota bacterium]
MNTQKVIKYQINEFKTSMLVFVLVIVGIMLLIGISMVNINMTVNGEVSSTMGGMEMGIVIFLFIVGLNSFRENFRFMIQNGVSRKTMFKGLVISTAIIALAMSLINVVILVVGKAFAEATDGLTFMGSFEQIYGMRYAGGGNDLQLAFEGLLFLICISAAAMMFGVLITTMYYRLNKLAKILVSVGIPVSIIIILPLVDFTLTGGQISYAIWRFSIFAFGFQNGANPYYGMVTCLITFAVCAAISWLLMRRAPVKD